VSAKLSELYRVDIGCHQAAALPLSGFEGATRKNKPNLEVGSVVFARVLVASKDLEPELVCFDSDNKADGFGEVKPGGLLTRCSSALSQSLQKPSAPILDAIGKHLPFEIIAGANGRFIINTGKTADAVAISSAIVQSQFVDSSAHRGIIKEMMTGLPSDK
jgi:exosome complex component RRP40